MQSVVAGLNVAVNFDLAGVTATAAEYQVLDGEGAQLVARQAVPGFVSGAANASVTVLAAHNDVPAGLPWAVREVRLFITTSGGMVAVQMRSQAYRLNATEQLPVPDASFVGLALAQAIVDDLVGAQTWATVTDAQRADALRASFTRLAGMSYAYAPDDWQSRVMGRVDYSDLFDLTDSEWAAMLPRFKTALQRAQVLDALAQLGQDAQAGVATEGVTEITIGDSSRKYSLAARSYRPIDTRALAVLKPFLAAPRLARG